MYSHSCDQAPGPGTSWSILDPNWQHILYTWSSGRHELSPEAFKICPMLLQDPFSPSHPGIGETRTPVKSLPLRYCQSEFFASTSPSSNRLRVSMCALRRSLYISTTYSKSVARVGMGTAGCQVLDHAVNGQQLFREVVANGGTLGLFLRPIVDTEDQVCGLAFG